MASGVSSRRCRNILYYQANPRLIPTAVYCKTVVVPGSDGGGGSRKISWPDRCESLAGRRFWSRGCHGFGHVSLHQIQTRCTQPAAAQCWANVADVGPALCRRRAESLSPSHFTAHRYYKCRRGEIQWQVVMSLRSPGEHPPADYSNLFRVKSPILPRLPTPPSLTHPALSCPFPILNAFMLINPPVFSELSCECGGALWMPPSHVPPPLPRE